MLEVLNGVLGTHPGEVLTGKLAVSKTLGAINARFRREDKPTPAPRPRPRSEYRSSSGRQLARGQPEPNNSTVTNSSGKATDFGKGEGEEGGLIEVDFPLGGEIKRERGEKKLETKVQVSERETRERDLVKLESKERLVANLANFAYDPYNFTFLRQLNVVELFLDCITEPNEKLVEFGAGGICNSCVDPLNAAVIAECDGIPLIIQCLSSPVRNTVNYALGALYYLCNRRNREEILRPEVVEVIEKYAAVGTVNISFSNLANVFLDKHVRNQTEVSSI
ncbi:hypothetical protein GIB67_021872 [Kingdonia uniflora]|uniref:Armadillo repeat-containing protein 7 n=1 Tax=Kingdonia uniflora TaxID=39325 RepID=A0A7J7NF43_9MAGN|nr:hypothetical protein GIB67_021872 [Kingdonia uniflora]